MNKFFSTIFCLLMLIPVRGAAQTFFDTNDPTTFFSLGVRAGINTSNKTFPSGHFTEWNRNNWGIGFQAGVLANLNFKEYLSVQPGLFLQYHTGSFSYVTEYLTASNKKDSHYEMGNTKGLYLTVPIMGEVKFNLAENIKWIVDLGPYFQIKIKENGYRNIMVLYRLPQSTNYETYIPENRGFQFGFKMGTGLRFYSHYFVGFHYLAGVTGAWKHPEGGKNKSWEFSLGYDF